MDRNRAALERLRGPVVPLNICFTDHDAIDWAAMRSYVDWLCRQKVPVLLLTYGSSEFCSLTDSEIWKLTADLAETIAGRSMFIASTGWWPPSACREFLKHADSAGVDAVKVQTHPMLEARAEVYRGYFDLIQDASPIPLMLWSPPSPAPIPLETVVELSQRPQIIGIKNDGDQFNYYYNLIRATADQNFAVISGGLMRNFAFGHPIGSPAYLCPIAPFRPDIALKFCALLDQGEESQALHMMSQFEDPWLKIASEMEWLPSIKSAIHLYGLFSSGRLRAPRVSHNPEQRETIRRHLQSIFGPLERMESHQP